MSNVRVAATAFACVVLNGAMAASVPTFPLAAGVYQFQISDAEFDGKFSYAASVTIHDMHISAIMVTCGGPFPCNELFTEGTIFWHQRSGQWIIAQNKEDFDAEEVGGCSGGPMTIDPQQRIIWYC